VKKWWKRNKVWILPAKAWVGLLASVVAIFLVLSAIQSPLFGLGGLLWFLSIVVILKMKGKNA
jgi:hypothetical protein